MGEVYDVIILGAGPAGVSAAIYGQRARLKVLWLEKQYTAGGQIVDTYEVDNYPGLPGVSGMELAEAMESHAKKLGIEPVHENVRSIERDGDLWMLRSKKKEYAAKTVLMACGAAHRHLGIPGEKELSGMGVSYCATCDGAFFRDKVCVVVGGGNVAVEDAVFLARGCEKVYVVHRRDELRAEKILQEQLFACKNVEMVWDSVPLEIVGENKVTGLKVKNVKSGAEQVIRTDGVFIAVGIVPNTELVRELVETDASGYIVAGEEGTTSAPGIFAAGDLRTKALRQVITAAADGANAITAIQCYLIEH